MDCPRCKLMMTENDYEGENVQLCGTCWGYWLTRDQLDKIVHNVTYKFSKDEKKEISEVMETHGDIMRHDREVESIYCPQCSKSMQRKKYNPRCPIEIDECNDCGIWA